MKINFFLLRELIENSRFTWICVISFILSLLPPSSSLCLLAYWSEVIHYWFIHFTQFSPLSSLLFNLKVPSMNDVIVAVSIIIILFCVRYLLLLLLMLFVVYSLFLYSLSLSLSLSLCTLCSSPILLRFILLLSPHPLNLSPNNSIECI